MAMARCQAKHCRRDQQAAKPEPRRAAHGLQLCDVCVDRLVADLTRIPGLHAECEEVLVQPRRKWRERVRESDHGDIQLDQAALGARSAIIGVLSSWVALVAEERGIGAPRRRQAEPLAAYLRLHVDWLAAHATAPDFAAEIAELAGVAHTAARPKPVLRFTAGSCTTAGCRHTVQATIYPEDESQPHQVACDAGHSVPRHQWLLLAREAQLHGRDAAGDEQEGSAA